ncbi:MAG TPA: ferritin [Janthinobacterium sp.]|nr:ferritin [Janthinobacterium sp.]
MPLPDKHKRPRWRLEDIEFDKIDVSLARDDEFLFLTLASASFVEILSETYSDNLVELFKDNSKVTAWLDQSWQHEEVQHGKALKAYVRAVWPEFDWDRGHDEFKVQYNAVCTVEQLESKPGLELVARCVVETGTSTFYRALHDYVREPVLRQLIDNIRTDEAAHYTHFRRHFAAYNKVERHGVREVLATMWRRLRDARGEDVYIAFKHVYGQRHPEKPFVEEDWQAYNRTVKRLARRYYPYKMAVKMLIKPIPMMEPLKRVLQWPLLGLVMLVSAGRT